MMNEPPLTKLSVVFCLTVCSVAKVIQGDEDIQFDYRILTLFCSMKQCFTEFVLISGKYEFPVRNITSCQQLMFTHFLTHIMLQACKK